MIILVIIAFLITTFLLLRMGTIVFDRYVFDFQVDPVLKNGEIKNLRDYRIVHNYIEMSFERDPENFKRNKKVEMLNQLMDGYHKKNQK